MFSNFCRCKKFIYAYDRVSISRLSYYVNTLAAFSGKRNVTVWRPSVCLSACLSRRHTYHDSPGGSIRHGHRTFLFNLVTAHVLLLQSLLLVHQVGPLWKSPIALFGTLHLVSRMNFPRNYACLVTHSLPQPSPSVAHGSSSPPPSPPSPLSVTTSVFHSELKTWLFGKSFPP